MEIDIDRLQETGLTAYLSAHQLDAIKDPAIQRRIGNNPMVVRAIGVAGVARTDPVLSGVDAFQILQQNSRSRFLEQLRILIIH